MSIIIVTASKPRADIKLGFNFKTTEDSIIITKIDEKSIFAHTKLQVGQKILTINQMIAHQNMPAVSASLGSGEVTIVVENPTTDDNKAIFNFIQRGEGPKVSIWSGELKQKSDYYGMMSNNTCPSVLKAVKLPLDKWLIIHALIVGKVMPISVKCVNKLHDFKVVYAHHQATSNQVNKFVPLAKGLDVCTLQSNANLVAISVKDKINSITNQFGVMAVLESEGTGSNVTKSHFDRNINTSVPIGFSFHLTNDRSVPIAVALPNAPPLGL